MSPGIAPQENSLRVVGKIGRPASPRWERPSARSEERMSRLLVRSFAMSVDGLFRIQSAFLRKSR